MIMLCIYDTVYVLLNILLFALPKMLKTYEASGYHYFVLPKAIPFGMTKYHHLNLFDNLCMTMSSYMCVVTVNILWCFYEGNLDVLGGPILVYNLNNAVAFWITK